MRPTAAVLLALLAACGSSLTLVVVNGLARGGGGMATTAGAHFDIVVRMEDDATDFRPPDLMRLLVDGVDRTDEVVMGGNFALLRITPPPVGTRFVELFRRTGPVLDTFTWDVQPYAGPTLNGVAPATAREGAQVTISGSGFAAGPLRVFFGGVEGTVDSSNDSSITATVPAGALPGLVFVLVGDQAAEGVFDFQPLDAADQPIPPPSGVRIFAVFPGNGTEETAVQLYGIGFDDTAVPNFNGRDSTRLFGVEVVTLPTVGDVLSAFAVVFRGTPPGPGDFRIRQAGVNSNELPFPVN